MILLLTNVNASPKDCYVYRETNGDHTVTFTWQKEEFADRIIISVHTDENNQYFENIYDKNGGTIEWLHRTDVRYIRAIRNGEEIIIKGTDQGKKINKVLKIDADKWCQAMSFSLRSVASLTDKKNTSFWLIRQDNLKAVKLRAVKQGTEILKINGLNLEAEKVVVRVDNILLSKLWCGNYWFGKEDNVFLQYKGASNPSNTRETVIQILHD